MSPVLSPTRIALEGPNSASLARVYLRDEGSSSGTSSYPLPGVSFPSSRSSTLSSGNPTSLLIPPKPTSPIENEKESGYEYVTLSVTLPYTTFTTIVLLGNSFPTASLDSTTYAVPTVSSSSTTIQTPGIPNETVVGIVIGLVGGFLALFAVLYVYLLRARQARRRRRRRRSRRGSEATAEGAPPPPPPPGGPPGPGPEPVPPAE